MYDLSLAGRQSHLKSLMAGCSVICLQVLCRRGFIVWSQKTESFSSLFVFCHVIDIGGVRHLDREGEQKRSKAMNESPFFLKTLVHTPTYMYNSQIIGNFFCAFVLIYA